MNILYIYLGRKGEEGSCGLPGQDGLPGAPGPPGDQGHVGEQGYAGPQGKNSFFFFFCPFTAMKWDKQILQLHFEKNFADILG